MIDKVKTVILCGGLGSRLGNETKSVPKPMIDICGKPIVCRIMDYYYSFGFKYFILATGYKSQYFKNFFDKKKFKYKVIIFYTGLKSKTGLRLLKCKKFFHEDENFMLTYGDGLSNHNIKKLYNFHLKKKKIATVTAVHPPARFGELGIKGNQVNFFKEKVQLKKSWISGGFFVFNYKIFSFLGKKKNLMLEQKPFQSLVKKKNLISYCHDGLWQCMDTLRDKEILEKLVKAKKLL